MFAQLLRQEEGVSEVLEFLILLPILLGIALLIWQMFIFGHAMVVTANAAREAARAEAACERTISGEAAARAAASGYTVRTEVHHGSEVRVTVHTTVPVLQIPIFLPEGRDVEIPATARMRCERGPRCRCR